MAAFHSATPTLLARERDGSAQHAQPWVLKAVAWPLVGVVAIFVLLRGYTRLKYVSKYGPDDYVYVAAFICFVATVAVLQICVDHLESGSVSLEYGTTTVVLLLLGETLNSIKTILSKASVGFFLLRIVFERWQRFLILGSLAVFGVYIVVLDLFIWLSCKPIQSGWDLEVQGTCLDTKPLIIIFCAGSLILDTLFVILPWVLVWGLTKPLREKIFIAGSLSLGIVSVAAGVVRLEYFAGHTLRQASSQMTVWMFAEVTATLVGVGLSTSIPVYRGWYQACCGHRKGASGGDSSALGQMQHCTIGGGAMPASYDSGEGARKASMPSSRVPSVAMVKGISNLEIV